MDRKRIIVSIDRVGNPTIEALNFSGCGCAEATKGIENALAGTGDGRNVTLKPEYYEVEQASQEITESW